MKPASARHRTDTTSRALMAEAQRLGVSIAPLGGAVDAICWIGNVARLVDFKTPGKTITDSQARLVANGCPLFFISTVDQMQALVAGMKKEAGI